jgi:sporulation protein YlmC with PRC-barrel domain
MDIEHGAEVIDKNGKKLGTVDRVIRDSYTSEIKKFTVNTDITDTDLFFSPKEVEEAAPDKVVLSISYDEGASQEVTFGAEVVDKDDKSLGTVDYMVRDTLSGNIKSFKVKTEKSESDLIFSTDDIIAMTPTKVKVNYTFTEK